MNRRNVHSRRISGRLARWPVIRSVLHGKNMSILRNQTAYWNKVASQKAFGHPIDWGKLQDLIGRAGGHRRNWQHKRREFAEIIVRIRARGAL